MMFLGVVCAVGCRVVMLVGCRVMLGGWWDVVE